MEKQSAKHSDEISKLKTQITRNVINKYVNLLSIILVSLFKLVIVVILLISAVQPSSEKVAKLEGVVRDLQVKLSVSR